MEKCSNINCPHDHYDEHAVHPCKQCQERERELKGWMHNFFNPKHQPSHRKLTSHNKQEHEEE